MLRRTLTVAVAAVMLVAPAGAAIAAPPGADLQAKLEAVHEAGMPGVFAEVRDGHRKWTPTAGVIDVTSGKPVRDGLRHRIGSITKTFVATTMLQLVREQKVGLDAPIGRYLPRTLVPAAVGDRVTVRMLLSHTSGIGNYTNVLIQSDQDIIDIGRTDYRPEQLARIGLAAAPTTTDYSYSNTNYILAGLIIERVTGHSYRTEVSRRILRPLHLTDTYFEGHDPFIRGPHMHAYVPWPPDGELRDFTRYNMSWAWAAGEMVSTADDLNVFYRALLTGRLLTPAMLTQMQTTVPMDLAHPEDGGYGLGLYWVQLPDGKVWGHDGGTIGHQTISWHTADGRRQMTYAQNMSLYRTSTTEPHPIDIAVAEFYLAAFSDTSKGQSLRIGGRPAHDRLTVDPLNASQQRFTTG